MLEKPVLTTHQKLSCKPHRDTPSTHKGKHSHSVIYLSTILTSLSECFIAPLITCSTSYQTSDSAKRVVSSAKKPLRVR
ncbi:hypothetical protein CEXT_159021 [Caerostris extrusa]|uniref:Uncharacterized protein n=1 Tax=Caerostris extrusa TaxID=172846 RepID=A0AAV4XS68_CAEEX|nr:hypothetical protein CEXT_159021 [Caerostris extrusa]